MRSSPQRKGRGFSLVELAVSLALLGLVALGLVAYLRQATQHKVIQQSTDIMETAQQALVGFAHANFRLPCPALDGNGIEICGNAQSGLPNQIGQLPWRTLGLANARAGRLRYGVYRAPNANPWLDSDLAVAKDRMVPLNNITANSPGAPSPPIPPVVYDSPADVSNLAHKNPLLGNVNLVDFCYATYRAANAPVSANALATVDANANATLRPVAFVLAAPGLLDADGDGDPFDGHQHSASQSKPSFDAANRVQTATYDDQVQAMGLDTLYGKLDCGEALSAIEHSHVNAATTAAMMAQAMVDYKYQVYISDQLAQGGILLGVLGVDMAAAGLALSIAGLQNAIAETIASHGALAALIAAGIADVAVNTANIPLAALQLAEAIALEVKVADFLRRAPGELVDPSAVLANSVDADFRSADALGF